MSRGLIPILLVMVIIFMSACGNVKSDASNHGSHAEEDLLKITYAPLNGVSGIAIEFGEEKGIFAAEGLEVEFVSTDDPIAALINGDIDMADTPTTNAILAAGKGASIKMVSSLFRSKGAFYLIGNNEFDSIEELKGKTIGAAKFGSGLDVYTRKILQEHGIDPDEDVNLIANGVHQEAYASLINDQVDATIIHEPWVSYAESEAKGKLLATGWDYLPTFHTGVLVASDNAISEKPEAIKRLLSAYFKSQNYAKENPEAFKAFYLENLNVDENVMEASLERELEIWENDPDISIDALNDTQNIQKEMGFQEKLYDVSKFIDLRFIPDD